LIVHKKAEKAPMLFFIKMGMFQILSVETRNTFFMKNIDNQAINTSTETTPNT
jgi:hypothetical protein